MALRDLRYRRGRLEALYAVQPPHLPEEERVALARLLQAQNEEGMVRHVERLSLTPRSRQRVEIVKKAREVGETLNEFSRLIPLPHDDIAALYDALRVLKDDYERLTWEEGQAEQALLR